MDQITLPVSAKIRSYPLSFIFQTIRLCIFGYVVVYGIWWDKRYQERDTGYGTVLTKVIGTVDTRDRTDLEPAAVYQRLWESSDIVQSSHENGALFITTNAIITPQQQQGNCAEDPFIPEANCTPKDTRNCIQGSILNQGNGKMTGECVPTQFANSTPTYTCEVSGWCPTERMVIRKQALFPDVKDFFILIKAFVRFPLFDKSLQNMLRDLDDTDLFRDCQEQNKRDNLADYDCPVFSLSYILKESGMLEDFDNIIAIEGGVLGVTVKWNCEFDNWENNTCQPKYIFRQLDVTDSKPTASWDFRFDSKCYMIELRGQNSIWFDSQSKETLENTGDGITYRENGVLTRDLHKVFGIFLIFNTEAMAGKFNPIDTLLELSAAFNLFEIASIACIAIITYASILKRKEKNPLEDSAMSSATPQDTSNESADSATDREQPAAQKNSSELHRSKASISDISNRSRFVNESHQVNMQQNSCSKKDDASLKLIIHWLKDCSKEKKTGSEEKKQKIKICAIIIVWVIIFIGLLVPFEIIKKSNSIYAWIAFAFWNWVFIFCLRAIIFVVGALLRYLLKKCPDSFFLRLSKFCCFNIIVITAAIALILLSIVGFLSFQVYLMVHYDLAGKPVSLMNDILAVIAIDICCGLLLKYTFSLLALLKIRCCCCCCCCSCSSCSKSNDQQTKPAQSDRVKDFVEHMHDLKKQVILEPAMHVDKQCITEAVIYVDKQSGTEPDDAINNSRIPTEATNATEETPVLPNDHQLC